LRVFDYAGHTLVFHGGAVQGYRGLIAYASRRGRRHWWFCGTARAAAPSGLLPSLMDPRARPADQRLAGMEEASEQDESSSGTRRGGQEKSAGGA
jgi:hypothetical protein